MWVCKNICMGKVFASHTSLAILNGDNASKQHNLHVSVHVLRYSVSHSIVSNSLWPHRLYRPWNSSGRNTGVGNPSLLQGIFPTQGLNPGFLHCRWILYHLSHKGSPRKLEWVPYPFSRGSSQPRNQTRVFCIAGRFFTSWATREAQENWNR